MIIKSGGAHGSSLSDLKELLSILSDPAKLKSALAEFEGEFENLSKFQKELNEKEEQLSNLGSVLAESSKAVSEKEDELSKREAEVKGLVTLANKKEAKVYQESQALAKDIAEFEKYKSEKEAQIELLISSAENKHKQASLLEAQASEAKQKFEEKYSKLMAIGE